MTIESTIMTFTGVVALLTLIIAFINFSNIQLMKMHISQMHTALGAMLPRIINTEQATVNLLRGFAEFTETTADLIDKIEIAISPNATQIYRTTDGKYTSPSIEGLISKIKSDNQEHKYFSTPDFKNLENQTKKLFEEDDISFLEDEDDEDDVLK